MAVHIIITVITGSTGLSALSGVFVCVFFILTRGNLLSVRI